MRGIDNKNNPVVQERWYKTFLGQRQQHTYWLYKVIDDIVTSNPQIARFVEIGTGAGALSVILALHAVQRGGRLLTYDNRPELHESVLPVFSALSVRDSPLDHWECLDAITNLIGGQPAFFFCDGGNKADEFNFYADHVPSGSVIAAHDYGVEVFPDQLEATVSRLSLEPIQPEDWNGMDDIQACFYKKP